MEASVHKKRKSLVKSLQRRATPAEERFRRLLMHYRIKYIFRKSFPIRWFEYGEGLKKRLRLDGDFYIADFYLPKQAAVVEIDGDVHKARYSHDRDRTVRLIQECKPIRIMLRFTNEDIAYRPYFVIQTILKLKKVRGPGTKENRNEKHKHNDEIARLNEIRSMVNSDNDMQWWEKKDLLRKAGLN